MQRYRQDEIEIFRGKLGPDLLKNSFNFFPIWTKNEAAWQFQKAIKTPKYKNNPFRILGLLHMGRQNNTRTMEKFSLWHIQKQVDKMSTSKFKIYYNGKQVFALKNYNSRKDTAMSTFLPNQR